MSPARLRTARLVGVVCLVLSVVEPAFAHHCGPPQIEIKVGRSYFWRIHADRTEVLSSYTPVLGGPSGVAEVFPRLAFNAHHGDFIITGRQPGTNVLAVNWFYAGTPAGGVCTVTIVVKPDDGQPDFQTQHFSGELVTRPGQPPIPAVQLHSLITNSIPTNALKLLIFAQCYGGNLALSPLFKDAPNTAISSGTSPNQQGRYGGFHDDEARGLRPAPGRTALDMHEEASAGKSMIWAERAEVMGSQAAEFAWSEWPRKSGGLPLSQFPLDPVTTNGAVRSRHIVIFAGRPTVMKEDVLTHGTITIPEEGGVKQTFSDAADRDQIKANFQGEPNTTIRTVGGDPSWTEYVPFISNSGKDGWDYPGDLDGLKRAIEEAGQAIRNAPDPSKEQFILYIADHGEQGVPLPKATTTVAPNSTAVIGSNLATPSTSGSPADAMKRQPDNQPQIRVQAKTTGQSPNRRQHGSGQPEIHPGGLALRLAPVGGALVTLQEYHVSIVDLDGDGNLESLPGEGIWLHFAVPEAQLLTNIFGRPLTIEAVNQGNQTIELSEFTLLTGGIAGDNADPQPHVVAFRQADAGNLEFTIGGLPNRRYLFETSTNLTRWEILSDRTMPDYLDAVAIPIESGSPQRFLRVRKPE